VYEGGKTTFHLRRNNHLGLRIVPPRRQHQRHALGLILGGAPQEHRAEARPRVGLCLPVVGASGPEPNIEDSCTAVPYFLRGEKNGGLHGCGAAITRLEREARSLGEILGRFA
jgi:hypothetical protein